MTAGGGLAAAAVNAVKKMKKMKKRWVPGKQGETPVRVRIVVPIKFSLKG